MVEDDLRLTNDEILSCYDGDETLTEEQMEIIKDFVALAAVITYEGLLQKSKKQNING